MAIGSLGCTFDRYTLICVKLMNTVSWNRLLLTSDMTSTSTMLL